VQHVDTPAQVDDGQARMGRHEPQDMLELIGVSAYISAAVPIWAKRSPASLSSALIPVDALLETRRERNQAPR